MWIERTNEDGRLGVCGRAQGGVFLQLTQVTSREK